MKRIQQRFTKTLVTENEYNKLGNCQPQIENQDYAESKIKIDKIWIKDIYAENSIIKKNTDITKRAPLKEYVKFQK